MTRDPQPSAFRLLCEDLRVVQERDPSVRSRGEALLAPYLPALWLYRVARRAHVRGFRVSARLLTLAGRLLSGGVDIHPGARVGRRLFIDHASSVVIGEDAVVGDDVMMYHQVTLGALGWWRDRHRAPGERRHPTIGDRVTIGVNASVLGPVEVGSDSVVGAHALVTSDVPPHSRVRAPESHCETSSSDRSPEARVTLGQVPVRGAGRSRGAGGRSRASATPVEVTTTAETAGEEDVR